MILSVFSRRRLSICEKELVAGPKKFAVAGDLEFRQKERFLSSEPRNSPEILHVYLSVFYCLVVGVILRRFHIGEFKGNAIQRE